MCKINFNIADNIRTGSKPPASSSLTSNLKNNRTVLSSQELLRVNCVVHRHTNFALEAHLGEV